MMPCAPASLEAEQGACAGGLPRVGRKAGVAVQPGVVHALHQGVRLQIGSQRSRVGHLQSSSAGRVLQR
jgi:hypothetical protein